MLSKRYSILGVILLFAVVLGACSPAPAAPTEAPAPPTEEMMEPTEAMAPEATEEMMAPTEAAAADLTGFKVAYLFPGVVNDGSYNTLGYDAMLTVQKEFGLDVQWNESVDPADAPRVIGEFAAAGANAVWAHSGTYLDPVVNTAPNFPDVSFVTYAGLPQDNPPANMWQQVNLEGHRQMFFLAGVISGLMTKSNVIGFVGGIELTTYSEGMDSFEMGAKWVNPDATVLRVWTGDFNDPAKAKEATIAHIEQGADVIAHATNLGVYGIIEALKENPNVYFVGKDIDQSPLLPDRTLCSIYIDYAEGMRVILPKIAAGELGGTYVQNMGNGGTVVTDLPSFIPADKAAVYNKIKAMVASDEINVRGAAADVVGTLPAVPQP
jgi:basic membrane protein A